MEHILIKWDTINTDMTSELTPVFREVIADMVRDRSVAVAFSGGLDSGIVAAIARDSAGSTVLYTSGVDDAYDVNESREMARVLGMEWHHIVISEVDIEDCVRHMIRITGTVNPITLSFEIPFYYVARYAAEPYIIGGQGADELFAGYSKYIGLSEPDLRDMMNADMCRLLDETLAHERAVAKEFGKEVLYPFLDSRVAKAVGDIDIGDLVPGDVRKKSLREVAEDIGQPEIAAKKKKAAQYGSGSMNLLRRIAKSKGMTVREMIGGMRGYLESLDWLYGLQKHGIKLGLRNIRELLSALGDPQKSFRSVHVAGTDGKGSVSAITASILRESGIRTGLYTSPHLVRFNERICVDGVQISDEELAGYVSKVRPKVEEMASQDVMCTFFEVTTAIAFMHFRDKGAEYAVIEVGMGGRYDATNVIIPDVSVITNISLEHTEYLGDTIGKIAAEKAGIIKEGVPVVTLSIGPALDVVEARAAEAGSDLTVVKAPEIVSMSPIGTEFVYGGERYTVGLAGKHQAINAATAVETVRLLGDERTEKAIVSGLRNVSWPARLQKLPGQPIVLDVTHTEAGARDLADDISRIYGKVTLVIGVLTDKDLRGIAKSLAPVVNRAVVASPDSERAMPLDTEMARISEYMQNAEAAPTVGEAVRRALEIRGDDTVLITGSHFTIGEAIRWLGT